MGRIVGIDPGSKRVGVAVSDSARTLALPRSSVPAGEGCVDHLIALVREINADVVVVGRPVSLAGAETASTVMADQLREELRNALGDVLVVAADERLSTVSATKSFQSAGVRAREQRERIDSAAAAVLLQGYLDALAP